MSEVSVSKAHNSAPLRDSTTGHMSVTFYVREHTEIRVRYTAEEDGERLGLHIGGYGGGVDLSLTREQWAAIVAQVDALLPVEVTA